MALLNRSISISGGLLHCTLPLPFPGAPPLAAIVSASIPQCFYLYRNVKLISVHPDHVNETKPNEVPQMSEEHACRTPPRAHRTSPSPEAQLRQLRDLRGGISTSEGLPHSSSKDVHTQGSGEEGPEDLGQGLPAYSSHQEAAGSENGERKGSRGPFRGSRQSRQDGV